MCRPWQHGIAAVGVVALCERWDGVPPACCGRGRVSVPGGSRSASAASASCRGKLRRAPRDEANRAHKSRPRLHFAISRFLLPTTSSPTPSQPLQSSHTLTMAGNKPITEQISDAVGAAGQKVGETFEAAKAQAASLTGTAEQKATEAKHDANRQGGGVVDDIKGAAAEAQHRAGETAEKAKHNVQEGWTETKHKVDEARPNATR
ncbi:hypothetical protein ACK3TF_003584 [Chlorella vulgaris]